MLLLWTRWIQDVTILINYAFYWLDFSITLRPLLLLLVTVYSVHHNWTKIFTREGIRRTQKVGCEDKSLLPPRKAMNIGNGLQGNKSQIQRICKHNTSSKAFTCCCKFFLQVNLSYCISSSTQLERGKTIRTPKIHNVNANMLLVSKQ